MIGISSTFTSASIVQRASTLKFSSSDRASPDNIYTMTHTRIDYGHVYIT